jgi:hypothetical protein
MKVIIAGSRTIPPLAGYELVCMGTRIAQMRGWEITEVVSGAARGVDAFGQRWAEDQKIPLKQFPAEWVAMGRRAGLARNVEMAKYADALIAITNGSFGTRHMIRTAMARKMPMVVIAVSGADVWVTETGKNFTDPASVEENGEKFKQVSYE